MNNLTLRFIVCRARDAKYDQAWQNILQYYLNASAATTGAVNDPGDLVDTRYVKILKDKRFYVDTPNMLNGS